MARRKERSIAGLVTVSSRALTAVLMLPALLSLVLMLVYAGTFSGSTARMETVVSLKPMVNTEIPEQTWLVVSGRISFDDSTVEASIAHVNATLDAIIADSGEDERLQLIVARRTMDTLSDYVHQIETNMATGKPVVESEDTLEEVRSVAVLVNNMLENYISSEVERSRATNVILMRMVVFSAIIEGLLLILALIIARYTRKRLARTIHEPIHQLEAVTGRLASGKLQARAPKTDILELTQLTDGVNIMADRLEELIAQNKTEQENLKMAELRTLQAQINPHFLYNTLDAIVWQAESGNTSEVIHITQALSDFFRISLSSGKDWITVSQEIKHLTGYLAIQKSRYRDILNYSVDIDDGMGDGYILKLLLQPLVENALYHGIKYRRGGGTITVTGRAQDGRYSFSVTDTGRGMSPEQLEAVQQSLETGALMPHSQEFPDHSGSGFGLRNVDQRIRLYYNQPDGLHIDSSAAGTCVSFCVPARDRGEEA